MVDQTLPPPTPAVRLKSSLPGDTTSRILTPSDTEIHPPPHCPKYLTRANGCCARNRATDARVISAKAVLCVPSSWWCRQIEHHRLAVILTDRWEEIVFFSPHPSTLRAARSHLLMPCQIIWCHRGLGLISGDEWHCQQMGTGVYTETQGGSLS